VSSYDVVVIGGGIIGASVTYYLSRENVRVALVEKEDIASGTSSHCDGNVLISDKQPGIDTKMTYISQQLLKELTETLDYDFDYVQRGSLLVIESEEELEVAAHLVEKQVQDGYPMRMLTKDQLLSQEPYFARDIIGGVEIDCDSSINPMALVFALVRHAERNGASVFRHCAVRGITVDTKGEISGVITDNGALTTRCVVNCAGVWAPQICKMVGIDIPIKPRQGQLLVTEPTVQLVKRKVMEFGYLMAKFGVQSYKRDVRPELDELGIALVVEPTLSGNFLIGSSRAFVGFNIATSIEVIRAIAERAMRFFPILKDINVIRTYAGVRPWSPDHFPIISQVKEVPGLYVAAGHEGDGIGLAPLTGKLVTQMIIGEETIVPTDKLSLERFQNQR
jgi:glycine/D-amino acid oxidase-like deaminating enzyme